MKNILRFTIPLWLGMIVNTLLGITDFYFLENISRDYLSVIGIAYIPFTFLSALTIGVGIEANRTLAKGDYFDFNKLVKYLILFTLIIVVLSLNFKTLIFYFVRENAMYQLILDYFSILIFLFIPTSIIYLCTGILRGLGIPEKSVKFNILAVIFNFIFDFIFIKLEFVENPIKGCAYASVLADTIVVLLYIYYLKKNKFWDKNKNIINISEFFKKASSYSIEKLCSSSTITIISSVYIAKLAIGTSSIYYGIDRFFMPIKMFAFCYFEWIIYSKTKKIEFKKIGIYGFYLLVLLVGGIFFMNYMYLTVSELYYLGIYILYCFLFLLEREIVAYEFSKEGGSIINKIIFFKSILLLLVFHMLYISNFLNLVNIGLAQSILLFLECFILNKIDKKYQCI